MASARSSSASRPGVPAPFDDASRGERLQKVMAAAGVASRRECEAIVLEGRVSVNGVPVTDLPAWVDPRRDRVALDGRPVARPPKPGDPSRRRRHLVLHKPVNVITTTDDPEGRRTVLDLLDSDRFDARRLYPVGRLDADSSGLILITDDGPLAHRLTHPRYQVPKDYEVTVRGRVGPETLEKLREGLLLAHRRRRGRASRVRRARMASVAIAGTVRDKRRGDRTKLEVRLTEGQNREIRRLLERLDHKVMQLKRVRLGPLTVKGLAPGAWRPLERREVQALYRAAKLDPDEIVM